MAGIDAFGTQWKLGDGQPTEVFTAVADVTNIDVLDIDVDSIDVTAHDSPSKWREFLGGLKDAGELSMDLNYDPSLHGTILAAAGLVKNMKIVLTDSGAAEVSFAAFVNGFKAQAPFDDKLSASVTLKVTGAVTITP